ncbi:FxsA family protein [Nocardioides bruguierae]|uniref:FxsA family protein n=1 Tax=Nocardioides bruguierae TaxID=2945102 RepID=UPI0020221CB4|nr:FxsA family protein [Nocardioides bruguierae]MCL8025891.1 FxsA family protein [Nocardioides bruguierae]
MSAPGPASGPRRRRSGWGWVLGLAFIGVPLIELWAVIQVGQVIGAGWTILLLVADSVLGAYLVRREFGHAWAALREALGSARMPARELADGALVLIGGTLLLTPGFVTDALGLAMVLPVTRPLFRVLLARFVTTRAVGGGTTSFGFTGGFPGGFPGAPGSGPDARRPGRGQGPVVRGDVVEPDEEDGPPRG